MIIDCISDLHGDLPNLEGGDLLLIAGDLTATDTENEYTKFFDWLYQQNYKSIVFIAGNHDGYIQNNYSIFNKSNPNFILEITRNVPLKIQYLCDSSTEFEGLKIYGSPWTKRFWGQNPHAMAFCLESPLDPEEPMLQMKFDAIPDDIDILITHSPPYGILDQVQNKWNAGERVGSTSLLKAVQRIKPKLHVFGHIHGSYGIWRTPGTKFVNAAHMTEEYEPTNKPIRVKF